MDYEKTVYQLLLELGLSPGLKGYHYIKWLICKMLDGVREKSYTEYYELVADHFDTNGRNVERGIRTCAVRTNMDTELAKAIFGNIHKLTNQVFLACIVEYLLHQKENPNDEIRKR